MRKTLPIVPGKETKELAILLYQKYRYGHAIAPCVSSSSPSWSKYETYVWPTHHSSMRSDKGPRWRNIRLEAFVGAPGWRYSNAALVSVLLLLLLLLMTMFPQEAEELCCPRGAARADRDQAQVLWDAQKRWDRWRRPALSVFTRFLPGALTFSSTSWAQQERPKTFHGDFSLGLLEFERDILRVDTHKKFGGLQRK